MTKPAVAFLFLMLNFYTYHLFATTEIHPPRADFARFPLQLGAWRCPGPQAMDEEAHKVLGVTDYLLCDYEKEQAATPVSVYLGYHASQVSAEGGGENSRIHPPAHCLPGSGWDIIDSRRVLVDFPGLPGGPATVNRVMVAKGDARELVFYWYQERGRVIARDWRKLLDLFWDRARIHRTDGALIRLGAPVRHGDDREAEAAIHDLAQRLVPRLPEYVPN